MSRDDTKFFQITDRDDRDIESRPMPIPLRGPRCRHDDWPRSNRNSEPSQDCAFGCCSVVLLMLISSIFGALFAALLLPQLAQALCVGV